MRKVIGILTDAAWHGAHGEGVFNEGGVQYPKVDGPLTDDMVARHLAGDQPFTIFLTEPGAESTRLAVIDLDNKAKYESRLDPEHDGIGPDFRALIARVVAALADQNLHYPLIAASRSGTGINIWLAFAQPQNCAAVKARLAAALAACDLQEGAGKGVGAGYAEIAVNGAQGVALPGFDGNPVYSVDKGEVVAWDADRVAFAPMTVQVEVAAEAEGESPSTEMEAAPRHPPTRTVVRQWLRHIDADDFDTWVKVGHALKHEFGDEGFDLWDEWSATSAKYAERDAAQKWNRLKPTGKVTAGTICHLARQGGWEPFHNTDVGNARRLVALYGDNLRFMRNIRSWLAWDGTRWCFNDGVAVARAARETARAMLREAAEGPDEGREALARWALTSESRARQRAMVELAEDDPAVSVYPDQLDDDDYLLSVRDGVVNLRTGKLVESHRDQLITKQAPVAYDLNAKCERWLRFLDEITGGDEELIGYLQRVVGYSLTGDTTEQCLFIAYGSGNNGKTAFLDVIQAMMGDYQCGTGPETFMARDRTDAVRNDVARLHGARFVHASELEEERRVNESLVKSVTGGERVQARFLYREFFEFKPRFKLFMVTNYKPRVRGDNPAIWRRMRLVPFTQVIPREKRDKYFAQKIIRDELPGILQWALRGCLDWQAGGLQEPKVIQQATAEYRDEEDVVRSWFKDNCTRQMDRATRTGVLYSDFKQWFVDQGIPFTVYSCKRFSQRLQDLGFTKKVDGGGCMSYEGVALKYMVEKGDF